MNVGPAMKESKMKTTELAGDEVRATVRKLYGKVAGGEVGSGCATTCCASEGSGAMDAAAVSLGLGYSAEETGAVPAGANLGLGCGNPVALVGLKPGEVVLDLGSGAGFDVFLAARAVGGAGRVIGVDMTPEMLGKARRNQALAGVGNAEFRLGEIENLPVADGSVDVILSNCVINLSPDKGRVFREAFRVLKPGGRLALSDIVALGPIPEELRKDWELYTGCVSGAALITHLRELLVAAGFARIRITRRDEGRDFIAGWFPGRRVEDFVASASIEAVKP